MINAIEIKNLLKQFDSNFKLNIDELNIPSGTIVGLIGENGAGKTTLIKSILNIIHPKNGEIKIFGRNISEDEKDIKEEIGIVLDNTFWPEILTGKDIDLIMKDVYKNWNSKQFLDYLNEFEIPINKPLKKLSKGMRKKLEIASALSHDPKLLILDEPTSGLDPVVRNEVLDVFLKFIKDEEHTILLSTHITSDLEHIADNIIFINDGSIVLNETRDEIMDSYGILKCDPDSFKEIMAEDIISYKKNKYDYQILVKNIDKIRKKYKKFVIDKITLEDLMVLMIKGEK